MLPALDQRTLEAVYDRVARRYDWQHAFFTARADQRGRRLLVQQAVRPGDCVLDCGAGTGSTARLAAQRVGPGGRVTLFDLSGGMLTVARERARRAGVLERCTFLRGDLHALPFADGAFDAALSTYSLCPVTHPVQGALEMLRVVKPGGRVGIVHSAEPERPWLRWLAARLEAVVWRVPGLSLGCRAVSVLPALQETGATVLFQRRVGVPLWPFVVFVVEKPAA